MTWIVVAWVVVAWVVMAWIVMTQKETGSTGST